MYEHNIINITADMMHKFYNSVDEDVKIKYSKKNSFNQKFIKNNEIITSNNIVLFVLIIIMIIVILFIMFFK